MVTSIKTHGVGGPNSCLENQAIKKIHNTSLSQSASHWVALVFGERRILKMSYKPPIKSGYCSFVGYFWLHIGIISFLLNWLLTPLLYWKWGRWLQMILLVFILWGFAILTGMQPAVVRAVTLFTMLFADNGANGSNCNVFLLAGLLLFCIPLFISSRFSVELFGCYWHSVRKRAC